MKESLQPGRRVLHKITGYYGIVVMTVLTGYFLVQFDGEVKATEVHQSELMPL